MAVDERIMKNEVNRKCALTRWFQAMLDNDAEKRRGRCQPTNYKRSRVHKLIWERVMRSREKLERRRKEVSFIFTGK